MNISRLRQQAAHWLLPAIGVLAAAIAASVLTVSLKPGAQAASAPQTRSALPIKGTGGEAWGANYFPNVVLTDQDGKPWRFFDDVVKDKVVMINLVFTSCAQSCGLETARLKEVHQLLGDRVGKDIFFYSISIDPLNDTPAALKEYAGKFGAELPGWRFLTGKPADIELIRRKLGMYDESETAVKNLTDHLLHPLLGNQATGRWMKGSPYENPAYTANQLAYALHNYKTAQPEATRYENAPQQLRNMSDGESIFRHRCAACHTIEGARQGQRPNLGPDLEHIGKRRDKQWLTRWIKEPDRMLAEKDPIATALFAQYNKVSMPNLKLDAKEIGAVLAFIEEESQLPFSERRVATR